MKKILIAFATVTFATTAYAGTKAPVAAPTSSLVDSSGKAVTTEAAQPVAIAQVAPVAPVAAPKTVASKPHAKKGAAHKKAAAKPAAKKAAAQ